MMNTLQHWVQKAKAFTVDAHAILGKHEGSPSRIVLLEESYRLLTSLTLKQDDLMRQALRCLENELYRAAHVMAWAAFMDFFEEKLASDGFVKLRAVRPEWVFTSIEDMREKIPEYQLIDASRDMTLCRKNEVKALWGLLNKRNECAHPSDFYPGLNETLGYMSELLNRIGTLRSRTF